MTDEQFENNYPRDQHSYVRKSFRTKGQWDKQKLKSLILSQKVLVKLCSQRHEQNILICVV